MSPALLSSLGHSTILGLSMLNLIIIESIVPEGPNQTAAARSHEPTNVCSEAFIISF